MAGPLGYLVQRWHRGAEKLQPPARGPCGRSAIAAENWHPPADRQFTGKGRCVAETDSGVTIPDNGTRTVHPQADPAELFRNPEQLAGTGPCKGLHHV